MTERYRIFKRTMWADKACTIPRWGRKNYSGQTACTEDGAREICRDNSIRDYGAPKGRGPKGMAWEYESF